VDFEYIKATDFDRTWLNFELDLPLEVRPDGQPNPFYVDRPGNPVVQLERYLLRRFRQPPKYFFSGHRGCGKSTELRRVAANPGIRAKYWPVHFTIKDEADVNNLDYKDVLLAIGGQMFRQYRAAGGKLPVQLLKELDSWRGRVEKEVTVGARYAGADVEGKLDAFFAHAGLKIKLEPATRTELHQVIERDVTGLIDALNAITQGILNRGKRLPLVLIDDLDKPDLRLARTIFYEHREVMLQPLCAIVYTVSSALFYSPEFEAIRDQAVFLPNVKLHSEGKTDERDADGYDTMSLFVHRRMEPELITPDALNAAIRASGGVFREMCRVMRHAVDRAQVAGRSRIEVEDVELAEAEIRGEYRRILTAEQRALLHDVRARNRLDEPDKIAPLLQILAVLEYANGEPWCDAHPALYRLLDEDEVSDESPSENRVG
jgi:hypothetical protein